VVDAEATAIRECAARVLSGESLASICRDPADRGITTTGGKKWLPTTIPCSSGDKPIAPVKNPGQEARGTNKSDALAGRAGQRDDASALGCLVGCESEHTAHRPPVWRLIQHARC